LQAADDVAALAPVLADAASDGAAGIDPLTDGGAALALPPPPPPQLAITDVSATNATIVVQRRMLEPSSVAVVRPCRQLLHPNRGIVVRPASPNNG
jgi:hypothetical protein